MSDEDDLGHASSLADQLRLAEENGNLPEELEEKHDLDEEDDGDGNRGRSEWEYFEDLALEPHQLATALEREYLDGDEVRVRTDRRTWVE